MAVLDLRTPRSGEQTAAAMVQVFNALPAPPAGLLSRWRTTPMFYFEIHNIAQTIRFQVATPLPYRDYLVGQLMAVYPELVARDVRENPLARFAGAHPTRTSRFQLARANHFPLQTFETLAQGDDPLSALLSALSRLEEGDAALLQLAVARAREDWKQSAVEAEQTTLEGNFGHLVKHKLAAPSFRFALHLVVQAPDHQRLEHLERSLSEALNVFQSPLNALERHRYRCWKRRQLSQILNRQVRPLKQVLSSHELTTLYHLPNQTLATIRNIAWGKRLLGEPPPDLPLHATTSPQARDALNVVGRVAFKNRQQTFGLRRDDRRRHMYVVGKTGVGKSTLLANMIINDLRHDEGLAVIDPHGDLIDTVLDYIPRHRINDTVVLDPADPEAVVKLNLFEGGSVVHRELIASGLVAMFHKLYGHSWGPRLEHILRNALLTLLSRQAKLEDVIRLLTDESYRQRVLDKLEDPVLRAFWRDEYEGMHDRQRAEAIAPVLNKIGQFVSSPLVRRVANAQKSSIDIDDIMNRRKILLVNVSQGKLGEDNAALLGAMLITKLQLAAMNRVYQPEDQRPDFFLYIDEFQNFATDSFIKILSEARKYRLNLVLANQYIAQLPPDVRAAIFGNAGNLFSFTVGAQDAALLQREFSNLYMPDDLVGLGRYQVICKLMIRSQVSAPFPARTLPLAATRNQGRDKVLRVSRERYARAA